MPIKNNDEYDPAETKRIMDEYSKSDICIQRRKRLREWEESAIREGYIIRPKSGFNIMEFLKNKFIGGFKSCRRVT